MHLENFTTEATKLTTPDMDRARMMVVRELVATSVLSHQAAMVHHVEVVVLCCEAWRLLLCLKFRALHSAHIVERFRPDLHTSCTFFFGSNSHRCQKLTIRQETADFVCSQRWQRGCCTDRLWCCSAAGPGLIAFSKVDEVRKWNRYGRRHSTRGLMTCCTVKGVLLCGQRSL